MMHPTQQRGTTVTVKELIEELRHMPQDAEVRYAYAYGDYVGSTLAATPRSVEMGQVVWSDYHSEHKVMEDEPDEYDDRERIACVLLSD
jgi:hypothetical protein